MFSSLFTSEGVLEEFAIKMPVSLRPSVTFTVLITKGSITTTMSGL